ncbi:MAG: alanine racemase [Balneolaceae bacterium]
MAEHDLKSSYIELSRSAFENNIAYLRSRCSAPIRLSAVIKGNAYGHGISKYLELAERCGIDHFSVFSADEAAAAHQYRGNPDTRIMIMGMIADEALEWAIENGIEYYLFDFGRLQSTIRVAKKMNKKARVHLQIETGMNRFGFHEEEYGRLMEDIRQNRDWLDVCGVCTHYAGAESIANHVRIQKQNERFQRFLQYAKKEFADLPRVHACSSAAFLTYPGMHYDMARIGIALYGFWPSRETYMHIKREEGMAVEDPLIRVLTWKSRVMSVKYVDEGEFIGYGNTYMATRNMRIATVPIGYTHGFARNLTNSGHVLINGGRANVVGLVNMNMITVDVTDISGVERGAEVVIIGKQGDLDITVSSFGEMSNNLNYEVLTRLPSAIPREIVG